MDSVHVDITQNEASVDDGEASNPLLEYGPSVDVVSGDPSTLQSEKPAISESSGVCMPQQLAGSQEKNALGWRKKEIKPLLHS